MKLFKNTKYIIQLDDTVTISNQPCFSSSQTDFLKYDFEYEDINTYEIDSTDRLIKFSVGDSIIDLYLFDENPS